MTMNMTSADDLELFDDVIYSYLVQLVSNLNFMVYYYAIFTTEYVDFSLLLRNKFIIWDTVVVSSWDVVFTMSIAEIWYLNCILQF